MFSVTKRPKVFCIGRNKTGTTSLQQALNDLGYKIGDRAAAERLIHQYAQRNFRPLVEYCRTADAFRDTPFSLPYLYQILDYAFPGSKFILSIRDNEDEWYQSLVKMYRRNLHIEGLPTKEDLLNNSYCYKGYTWEANRIVFDTPEDDPFNERILKEHYLRHNADVIKYFQFRDDLLVINLKETDGYAKFCDFLDAEPVYEKFPVLNQSPPSPKQVERSHVSQG
jgi:hypothetical protein